MVQVTAACLDLWQSTQAFIFIAKNGFPGSSPWHAAHSTLCFAWLNTTKSGSTYTGFSGRMRSFFGKASSAWQTLHFCASGKDARSAVSAVAWQETHFNFSGA